MSFYLVLDVQTDIRRTIHSGLPPKSFFPCAAEIGAKIYFSGAAAAYICAAAAYIGAAAAYISAAAAYIGAAAAYMSECENNTNLKVLWT